MLSENAISILEIASTKCYLENLEDRTEGISIIDSAIQNDALTLEDREFLGHIVMLWKRAINPDYPSLVSGEDRTHAGFDKFIFYLFHGEYDSSLTSLYHSLAFARPGSSVFQYVMSNIVDKAFEMNDMNLAVLCANVTYHHYDFMKFWMQFISNTSNPDKLELIPLELGLPMRTAPIAINMNPSQIWKMILDRFMNEDSSHFKGREDIIIGIREELVIALEEYNSNVENLKQTNSSKAS